MKKLRLLVTADCDRQCKGCCNKDWDLDSLEAITNKELKGYDEILLTGGEPMLYPRKLADAMARVRAFSKAKLYIYTANTTDIGTFTAAINLADGVTLTLHTQKDVNKLQDALTFCKYTDEPLKGSLRLNVFKGIDYSSLDLKDWIIKDNMVWIKDCPLPTDEIFKKI